MQPDIQPIRLRLSFRMGTVNCYLLETKSGYALVDTGGSNNRQALIRKLASAGCRPGLLKLVLLTHGDFDHSGNAAYLRSRFGSEIAMHADDAGMVERGDMFANRRRPNFIMRLLLPIFAGFGRAERFEPDVLLEDGDELVAYGLDARVISIPGHSQGSIGILTGSGELFCGDLLENLDRPVLGSIMDKPEEARASLQKLAALSPQTVYPGHGDSFSFLDLIETSYVRP